MKQAKEMGYMGYMVSVSVSVSVCKEGGNTAVYRCT